MRSWPQGVDGVDKNPYTLICGTIDTLSRWFTFMPRTVFLLNATPLERMYAECSLRYLLKPLARTPPQSISESR